jgi:hypothetical protein
MIDWMIDLRSGGEDGSHSTDEKRRERKRRGGEEEIRRTGEGARKGPRKPEEGGRGMTRASVLSGVFCLIRYEYDISSFCSMMIYIVLYVYSLYIIVLGNSHTVSYPPSRQDPDMIMIGRKVPHAANGGEDPSKSMHPNR